MSDLTRFRDHCRRMASATHTDECGTWTRGWRGMSKHRPDPTCSGCVNAADRALWAHLADEIDSYLAGELQAAAAAGVEQPLEGL